MTSQTITVSINGSSQQLIAQTSLEGLISQLELTNQKIAIELNQTICPRSDFHHTQLQDGDEIEIITAVGGG